MLAILRLQELQKKAESTYRDESILYGVLLKIQQKTLENERFIPPMEPDPDFVDANVFESLCYSRQGGLIGNDLTLDSCFYKVYYYKEKIYDQSFGAANPLRKVPLSRVRFKITYFDRAVKRDKTIFSDRLIVATIYH